MTGQRRTLASLVTLNLALLMALVLSVLTQPQPATAEAQPMRGRYAIVAGEQSRIGRTGSRPNTIYIVDLQQSLVVALMYDVGKNRLEPVAVRSLVQDIENSRRESRSKP
jgi:hypothetical protein